MYDAHTVLGDRRLRLPPSARAAEDDHAAPRRWGEPLVRIELLVRIEPLVRIELLVPGWVPAVKRSTATRTAAAVSAGTVSVLLASAGGCGSDGGGGQVTDAAPADAGADRGRPSTQPEWKPEEPPSPLEGWKILSEYDISCGFYYATERKYLPPPVEWEPCSVITDAANLTDAGTSGPPGMVCERMATPWAASGQAGGAVYLRSVHVEDAQAYLLLDRVLPTGAGFTMVAEADGPVHTALYDSGSCRTSGSDVARFGHILLRVYDSPGTETRIGGSFEGLKPRVYFPKGHQPSSFYSHEYAVGRSLFIEAAIPDRVYSFATGELVATISPKGEDKDLYYSRYRFQEDTLYWVGATTRRSAVKVWTKERGIFTLLDDGRDVTRGVESFTTDGIDMVWLEGRGRTNFDSLVFDAYEHWTAKYSLDPATVNATKRRVRSEPRAAWGHRYAVGCGYAAIQSYPEIPTGWGQSGFRLIRLSDGRSWPILDDSEAQQGELHFAEPLGITCEHVYLHAWSSYANTEAVRIRLDSLGEGIAPD